MELRGRRHCTECGNRWSYFETGTAACPACGSISSVSRGQDAELHTDGPADLDLGPARSALGDGSFEEAAEQAHSAARDYLRSRGFVSGGELLPLDDGYLAAADSVDAYRRDVARWLERPPNLGVRPLLDRLRTHERRIAALDGDVPTEEPEALVAAARGLGRFLREDDGDGLEDAEEFLDELG